MPNPRSDGSLLCFLAGSGVSLDEDALRGALRRSELLLAAGGDPRRTLELFGRAVTALADDLDDPALRGQLAEGLARLAPEAEGLQAASEALRLLRADGDLAWQSYAMALLADAIGDGGSEAVTV